MGTDDSLVAGVLPGIAADLRIGEAAAGQPVLVVATARMARRGLLAGGLALFALLNLTAASHRPTRR